MAETSLSIPLILSAYLQGAFPMADEETGEISFYMARQRALLPIESIRVSKSLAKTLRKQRFEITYDKAFEEVIQGCRRPEGTWISDEIVDIFIALHRQGWAHSCEAWNEGRLAGGVYGIAIGGTFSAESMFHRVTDASKVALRSLVLHCCDMGFRQFDAQVMSPHLKSLGAYEMPHAAFLENLRALASLRTDWSPQFPETQQS